VQQQMNTFFSPNTQKKIVGKLHNGKKIVIKEVPNKTDNAKLSQLVSPPIVQSKGPITSRKVHTLHQLIQHGLPSKHNAPPPVSKVNFQRILQKVSPNLAIGTKKTHGLGPEH